VQQPSLRVVPGLRRISAVRAEHSALGTRWFYADQAAPVLVTENETNNERVFGSANETRYVKDGIDRAVVHGDAAAVDPRRRRDHRSAPLPGGGWIDQADGTAWMALYCQNMMQIALELAPENPVYLEQAQALLENLAWIAAATSHVGPDGISLWDEQDGFFYDVLRRPDGSSVPLRVRSLVGLMPLAAATVIGPAMRTEFPQFVQGAAGFLARHPAVTAAWCGHGQQLRQPVRCCSRCSTRRGCAGFWPGCWMRRNSSGCTCPTTLRRITRG
jgi:hypothetical protein